jgi:5-(aminomethyl)-3-furanmethanol phosphate kinase
VRRTDVDIVVKLGGGLLAHPEHFQAALAAIASRCGERLLIVPGGGAFADAVRGIDRRIRLPDIAAHWMAVLAMEQYAHLLASQIRQSVLVHDRDRTIEALDAMRLPVLAPYRWLQAADPLPHSWEVTSDSIAAWIAGAVGARRLVLIKPPGVGVTRILQSDASDAPRVRGKADLVDGYFERAVPRNVDVDIVAADQLDAVTFARTTSG